MDGTRRRPLEPILLTCVGSRVERTPDQVVALDQPAAPSLPSSPRPSITGPLLLPRVREARVDAGESFAAVPTALTARYHLLEPCATSNRGRRTSAPRRHDDQRTRRRPADDASTVQRGERRGRARRPVHRVGCSALLRPRHRVPHRADLCAAPRAHPARLGRPRRPGRPARRRPGPARPRLRRGGSRRGSRRGTGSRRPHRRVRRRARHRLRHPGRGGFPRDVVTVAVPPRPVGARRGTGQGRPPVRLGGAPDVAAPARVRRERCRPPPGAPRRPHEAVAGHGPARVGPRRVRRGPGRSRRGARPRGGVVAARRHPQHVAALPRGGPGGGGVARAHGSLLEPAPAYRAVRPRAPGHNAAPAAQCR